VGVGADDILDGRRVSPRRGEGLLTAEKADKVRGWLAGQAPDGPHRSPKGLRHGFGVHAISSGVPLNMLSKWMGHASLEVTAIYANALGTEEQGIAARMWERPSQDQR
jgi:integrase